MPHLSWNEVRERAIRFSREHAGDRSESAEKQTFWNDFFNVFGLRRASLASFEANVINLKGNKGAIDLLWRGKLLVEHKSFGEDLALAETQAFTYIEDLTRENRWEEIPRFVLVSDFARFVLYDLEPEEPRGLPLFDGRKIAPHHFVLAEFPRHIRQFAFMLGQTRVRLDPEDPANEKAYRRMCELHDALKTGGFDPHDLERLLVRILFCLFAEDTSIFEPDAFTQFVRTQTREDGSDLGARLNELFGWLNDPRAEATLADTDPLYGFRYVNGGLFQSPLRFARFDRRMRDALLFCCDFQWAKISPAVFGSLFQGVLEDRARRQQGAHYTSERDIMKVLRSLFLDEMRAEWERVKADRSTRRRGGLEGFHQRLRSLEFLDPACGCGNFLVLAYRELRLLEIDVVRELTTDSGGQGLLPIVNVDQFHGIEYAEWPVRIAEVALWLMDHQMNAAAGEVFGRPVDRLPLTASPHIVQGNALRVEWSDVLPSERCAYVLGNPPFVGKHYQTAEQKTDLGIVLSNFKNVGDMDYVVGWFKRAAEYIQALPPSRIHVGFVATNSITQGEQVPLLWGEILNRYHLTIHFAHRPFAWESESSGRAHVHVVIIGFAAHAQGRKFIFDADAEGTITASEVDYINPYLLAGATTLVRKRRQPLGAVPDIRCGNKPSDGGHLLLDDAAREALLDESPEARPFIRRFVGSDELINGTSRWCIWLADASVSEWRAVKAIKRRVEAVRDFRVKSTAGPTKKAAESPALFFFRSQPPGPYIAVPEVSSERRNYIPIAILPASVIASNKLYVIESSDTFLFGVLSSGMHMSWVRVVGGRLESRFQYSGSMVYNTFPWPENATSAQQDRVRNAAQEVLAQRVALGDGRLGFLPKPNERRRVATLADLYDPIAMPLELVKAHRLLDRAVERCYRRELFHSDRERVEHLFGLYEQLTAPLLPATPTTKRQATL